MSTRLARFLGAGATTAFCISASARYNDWQEDAVSPDGGILFLALFFAVNVCREAFKKSTARGWWTVLGMVFLGCAAADYQIVRSILALLFLITIALAIWGHFRH